MSTGTDGRSALEVELNDQLRALDDLDAEFEAGDLDEADYAALKDSYTVRVADIVRKLDRIPPVGPTVGTGRSNPWPRRLSALALVTLFAAGAGWLLARSAGERGVNDLLTGQIQSSREKLADCQQLGGQMDLLAALQCFDEVLLEEPDNVEALTYRGWFVVLAGSSAEAGDETGAELLVTGRAYLDRAVEIDPTYLDARAFRAAIYDRSGDADAACSEVEALLALDPPQFFVDQTRGIVDRNRC